MGVTTDIHNHVILRPFDGSSTLINLRTRKCCVLNVTHEPEYYYKPVRKQFAPATQIPDAWFTKAETVDAPRLCGAYATIEMQTKNIEEETPGRFRVTCQPVVVNSELLKPFPYCRSRHCVIESTIHVTRVPVYLRQGRLEDAKFLLQMIQHYRDLCKRVAPDSQEAVMVDDIHRIASKLIQETH